MTHDLNIPSGKKSGYVRIPKSILGSRKLEDNFLAGLFDTDGGIRGKTLGFTSASPQLIVQISTVLNNLKVKHSKEQWLNKQYDRKFYGIRISTKDNDRFLNSLPLKNKRKRQICFHHVDVPERSNGLESGNTWSSLGPLAKS